MGRNVVPQETYDSVLTTIKDIIKEEVPHMISGFEIRPHYSVYTGDREGLLTVIITMDYLGHGIKSSSHTSFAIEPEDPTTTNRIRDRVVSMVRGIIHYANDFCHSILDPSPTVKLPRLANWDAITKDENSLAEFVLRVTECCNSHDDVAVSCEEAGCPFASFSDGGCDKDTVIKWLHQEV